MVRRLTRDELLEVLNNVLHSAGKGFTSEQINEQLDIFCLNCPDPVSALDLVLEAPVGSTTEETLDQILAKTPRDVSSWSYDELAQDHPLRHLKLDSPH